MSLLSLCQRAESAVHATQQDMPESVISDFLCFILLSDVSILSFNSARRFSLSLSGLVAAVSFHSFDGCCIPSKSKCHQLLSIYPFNLFIHLQNGEMTCEMNPWLFLFFVQSPCWSHSPPPTYRLRTRTKAQQSAPEVGESQRENV